MQGTKSIRRTTGDLWNRFRTLIHAGPRGGRTAAPRSSQLRLEALEERSLLSAGPYPPAAGESGSTAIHMDDTAFVGWATGWENYNVGSNVDAQWQTPEEALGKAVGDSYDIVSLGRGGEITLTFDTPIVDGPGWDFATFENGFGDTFLELGYVEVSSNGTDFFRFPNDSLTFEDVGASLADDSYWNGPDPEGIAEPYVYGGNVVIGAFESGGLRFNNNYAENFGSWTGWSYSNTTDTTTPGYLNQYSAYTGSGAGESRTYSVAFRDVSDMYAPPTIERTAGTENAKFRSISITNTTYAALSMLNGDDFATKFGNHDANGDGDCDDPGDVNDGSYPDWFLLTITGRNGAGASVGEIEFYLADYQSPDDSQDYIIDEWTTIDLTPLEDAETLEFVVTSSDVGVYGMNTPAYFAADNITLYDPNAYFEDADIGGALAAESYWNGSDDSGGFDSGILSFNNSFTDWGGGWTSWDGWAYSNMTDTTTPGYDNQYSAVTGEGANDSPTYGVACQGGNLPTVSLPDDTLAFESMEITNTTYAALSMLDGDDFATKFGNHDANGDGDCDDPGDVNDGSYPDWFLLTITGRNGAGASVGEIEFYLADYQSPDDSQDYIIDEWTTIDLTSLVGATSLEFSLSSSDVGVYGMNTPGYFAADNIVVTEDQPTYADIVGRTGSGGDWFVAKSDGTSFTNEHWGKWSTAVTWNNVLVGDFTGDGKDDVVGRADSTGDWFVGQATDSGFVTEYWGKWHTNVDWDSIHIGDFTGDGKDDLLGRASSSGDWFVAESTGDSFVTEPWGKWTTAVNWDNILVGDFNGDGKDDVVGRATSSGDWFVSRSTGSSFAFEHWGKWTTAVSWDNVLIGDFSGDGRDDIVGRATSSGDWFVSWSTGSAFTFEHWGKWTTAVSWDNILVGDFNGDGKDDVIGRAISSGDWFVAKSSGTHFDTEPWGKWTTAVNWSDVCVGDFTGDGSDDLVGRADSSGDWFVSRSTGTALVFEHWGKWTTRVPWVDIQVGDFNRTGATGGVARATASAAADQFWSNIGSEDEDAASLQIENEVVNLLMMEE